MFIINAYLFLFAIFSRMNAPTWFASSDRKFMNRLNGTLMVAVFHGLVLVAFYQIFRVSLGLPKAGRTSGNIFGLIVVGLDVYWILLKGKGEDFVKKYKYISTRQKIWYSIFLISNVLFFIFVLFFGKLVNF